MIIKKKILSQLLVTCFFILAALTISKSPLAQTNALDSTRQFIKANWENVIHTNIRDSGTLIGLPFPYSAPGQAKTSRKCIIGILTLPMWV